MEIISTIFSWNISVTLDLCYVSKELVSWVLKYLRQHLESKRGASVDSWFRKPSKSKPYLVGKNLRKQASWDSEDCSYSGMTLHNTKFVGSEER